MHRKDDGHYKNDHPSGELAGYVDVWCNHAVQKQAYKHKYGYDNSADKKSRCLIHRRLF